MVSTRVRWTVPAGVAAVVLGVALVPSLASADPTPKLPTRTAAALLTDVGRADVPGLTGTVASSAALGLPSLEQLGVRASAGALVSGTHTLRVWSAGRTASRLELDDSLHEYDIVRRGAQVWTYDSETDQVTHTALPAYPAKASAPDLTTAHTPQEAATAALAALDPSTVVTVEKNRYVAGRPAYELVLTPKDHRSLIGSVRLAVDGATKVPLQVQVLARRTAKPAFSLGFTQVDFTAPATSVFATPTGKALVQAPVRPRAPRPETSKRAAAPVTKVVGTGWTAVVEASGVDLKGADMLGQVTSPVTVGTVRGHLFTSALVSALVLDDGRAYAGAVTPATLTALAAGR